MTDTVISLNGQKWIIKQENFAMLEQALNQVGTKLVESVASDNSKLIKG
jgi:hypothetical protein